MELNVLTLAMAVGAGLASVLSPCVLPVVPIVMAGAERDDRLRPLLVVTGLALSFMAMGAVSSLFGALLIGKTRAIEIGAATIIVLMGLMVMFDQSIFKRLSGLTSIQVNAQGRLGGLLLGLSLGVIWVPCVGPFLSSTLTMVGTRGELSTGITLLGFYSIGLAIPMLIIGYSSQWLQNKIKSVLQHEAALRYITGGTLVAFGTYQIFQGNLAF